MSTRWHLAVLGGLALLLLVAGLGTMALTDRDEGANAEAAREMLEQRSWITPTLNYAPRFAKPAFVYWLMAGSYAALGVSEVAARLPSAIAATALVGLQYAFARWAFGAATAFRAALVLLLAGEFVVIARMALTDAVLVLWTTAAAFAFFRAHHGPPPRGRWYTAAYVAMGLGMLAKGPVGVLVPAVAIAGYLLLAGGWRRVWREGRPLWGLLLLLAVAGPWYVAMLWAHGADYAEQARGETLGRVFRPVTGPDGTMLFYVPVVLVGLFPWSALLPNALLAALRGARARAAADRAGAARVFAAVWVLAVLVLFSLVQSRLPHYIAPLFPAAALLLAATWPPIVPAAARGLLAVLGLLVGGAMLAGVAMGPAIGRLLEPAYPAAPGAALSRGVLAVAALALAGGTAAVLRDGARLFRALAILTTALLALGLHVVLPAFNAAFVAPAGELVRDAGPAIRPCDTLVALGPYRPSLAFYARRPILFLGIREHWWLPAIEAASGRLFLLTPHALVRRIPPSMTDLAPLDARGGYLLLASPPADGPCK